MSLGRSVALCGSLFLGVGCGAALRAAPSDGELRGREIVLRLNSGVDGFRIEGALNVAVPPDALLALTYRPDAMVQLFGDHVVGAARWPLQAGPTAAAADRVYFAAKMFGRIFRAWGHVSRRKEKEHTELTWRTDKGALGAASAQPRGRGSAVRFMSFFPRHVDLVRFINRIGAEILLRVIAFAVRARLEQLWRESKLPRSADGAEARAVVAGLAPRFPWPPGTPPSRIPVELRVYQKPAGGR